MTPEQLLDRTLLLPTPDDPEEAGHWTLVERDVLTMLMEEDELGLLTPAFTDPAALERWRPEGGCHVARDAAWVFGLVAGDPEGRLVIDPGSPSALVLGPAEVATLAAGTGDGPGGDDELAGAALVGAGTFLLATPLEPLPPEVDAAVRAALAAEPAVRSAKLFLFDQTGAGPLPSVFVDLDPTADPNDVMPRVVGRIDEAGVAGGLTFTLVIDAVRADYEAGGLPLVP